jgi:uncharacterized protein DUF3224
LIKQDNGQSGLVGLCHIAVHRQRATAFLLDQARFAGDLVGTSKGEMLSAQTETKGSAGYVAVEKVVGELDGRKSTFVLQHSGTMDHGQSQLSVVVVPDSGTEGFAGIRGTLQIDIKDGKHFYDFEYSLPQ